MGLSDFSENECGGYFIKDGQCHLVPAGLASSDKLQPHNSITFYKKTDV